jgi:hypothetical protein
MWSQPSQDRPLAPRIVSKDKAVMIDSREKMEAWLKGRSAEHAQAVATRAALRVLPSAFDIKRAAQPSNGLALALFRATSISWAARNFPAHASTDAAFAAYSAAQNAARNAANAAARASASAAAYAAAHAAVYAADAAYAAYVAVYAADATDAAASLWNNLSADCDWLEKSTDPVTDTRRLTHEPLWPRGAPEGWHAAWDNGKARLLALDSSWQVWTDWYDRRISGNRAAFDIPGDTNRIEDKKILVSLADATDDNFWGKGYLHVNTTLGRWLAEARARTAPLVAPDEPPEQDPAAIGYGVNDRGQLDRLPAQDQQHLRDIPDQQFLYGRIRETALELLGEGQRLGTPLEPALGRFAAAMPATFAAALALPLWTEGIILRRLYRAHRLAMENRELSRDQLEPVIGERLGGLLDLYNHFAFGDPGLRAKDETKIAPQERADAETEAAAAAPLADAILQAPEVATDRVIEDIEVEADSADLPSGDPYADQARDQSNRNWRNRVAGILTGLRRVVVGVGTEVAKGALSGVIAMGLTDAATGTKTLAALGKFVATNAQAFITYVSTAFPAYNLTLLIEAIAKVFG